METQTVPENEKAPTFIAKEVRVYQSDDIAALAGSLAKAQSEITHAGKEADNPFFKSKYAPLPTVMVASRPFLSKNGLSIVQLTDFTGEKLFLVTQLSHSSGQWIRSWYPINPIGKALKDDKGKQIGTAEPTPQEFGSAITYARRYAYCAMTGVAATGEDDDANNSSRLTPTTGDVSAKQAYGSVKLMKAKFSEIASEINNCSSGTELDDVLLKYNADFSNMRAIDEQLFDNLCQLGQSRRDLIMNAELDEQMNGRIGE